MWLFSLILGGFGLLLSWIPLFGAGIGLPAAIVGTGLGVGSLVTAKSSQSPAKAKQRSLLALGVSLVGLVAGVTFTLIYR